MKFLKKNVMVNCIYQKPSRSMGLPHIDHYPVEYGYVDLLGYDL